MDSRWMTEERCHTKKDQVNYKRWMKNRYDNGLEMPFGNNIWYTDAMHVSISIWMRVIDENLRKSGEE